jgi:30S ribosomal protein S31
MGKGDKKTKRGKIIMGSYGVRRPQRKKQDVAAVSKPLITKVKVAKPEEVEVAKEKKKPVIKKAAAEKKEEAVATAPKKKTTRKPAKKETKEKKNTEII